MFELYYFLQIALIIVIKVNRISAVYIFANLQNLNGSFYRPTHFLPGITYLIEFMNECLNFSFSISVETFGCTG
jgi:hypothetical protein